MVTDHRLFVPTPSHVCLSALWTPHEGWRVLIQHRGSAVDPVEWLGTTYERLTASELVDVVSAQLELLIVPRS